MVCVEIDGPKCESLYFRPLGKTVRGSRDLLKEKDPAAMAQANTVPNPIPGQRIEYDAATGKGAIVETLYDDENAALRDRIWRAAL